MLKDERGITRDERGITSFQNKTPLLTIWGKSCVQENDDPNTGLSVTPQVTLSGSENFMSSLPLTCGHHTYYVIAWGEGLLITKFSCQLIKNLSKRFKIYLKRLSEGPPCLAIRRHFWNTLIILQHRLHFAQYFLNLGWQSASLSLILLLN